MDRAPRPKTSPNTTLLVGVLALTVLGGTRLAQAQATQGGPLPTPLPLFPADNWWNLDITNAPVDTGSAAFITHIGATKGLHPDFGGEEDPSDPTNPNIYGIPYIVVDGTQAKKAVEFEVWDESDGVDPASSTHEGLPFYPIPDAAINGTHWIEGGAPGTTPVDGDRHMLIVDRTNKYLYELYNVWWDGTRWTAYSGAFFDMKTNNRRTDTWTSADAAGLAVLPGLIRYDEATGTAPIGHAFRMTVRDSNGYVYPASHRAGSASGALPMGARLRLKASKSLTGYSPIVQKIFQAMKTYGLIVADNGSDMYVSGSFDTRWDNDVLNPAFASLTAGDFEVVQRGYAATATPTATGRATATSTPRPTATVTLTPTATARPTATSTARPTATATTTPRPTATSTVQPTATSTLRPTATSTARPTATATATARPTATSTARPTATATSTASPSPSPTVPTGNVLHVSPAGSDGNACTAAASCRQIRRALQLVEPGGTILVEDGSYLGFDVAGKSGTADAKITILAAGTGANVTVTTDRTDNRDTIYVTGSSYVVIDGLRASGATRAGVRVSLSSFVTIRNGVFANNARWGIFTDFSDDLLIELNQASGSVAEHGIYVSNSSQRPTVRWNHVFGNNASGIQLNADLSNGAPGLIRGALIANNLIHDNGAGGGGSINLDGVQDSIVRNNVLYDNHNTAIANFKQDGADGPRGMQVYNNTVVQAADGRNGLQFTQTTGLNTARNNILIHPDPARGGLRLAAADVANVDTDYNVLDRVVVAGSTLTLAQFRSQYGKEAHSLSATPAALFLSPSTNNYDLAPGSPAIDAGATVALRSDIAGRSRPQGLAYDIGAYEALTSATPTPSATPTSTPRPTPTSTTRPTATSQTPSGTDTYFLNVLQAKDSGAGGDLTISYDDTSASSYTVTLTHPTKGTAVIVFNKGMGLTGGAVGYSASGTPGALNTFIDHVQGFQVTDSGPAWSTTN